MVKHSIREGIQKFLAHREPESPYLIPKWNIDLESQYLVHKGSVAVDGVIDTWTDGSETWAHHRWPRKAGTDPNYNDRKLTFSPGAHLKRMGSTWWNFRTKRSVGVALDIDLEGEHAASTTTVTKIQLVELIEKLKSLDYLTLVRSSGGNGVHIYCFFDENHQPESANHNEHAMVANALVAKISFDLNYNFRQHMDAVGVIFWFWSCDSPENHQGYELIHEQTTSLKSSDLEEYLGIGLSTPNQKVKVDGYTDSGEKVQSQVEGSGYKSYDLDQHHKDILKELEGMGYSFIWNPEYKMAHTHTMAIKELFDKMSKEGRPMRGVFNTISKGTDKGKPNCYITPRENGVFQVKRFGTATAEHPIWQTRDEDTWCYLNQEAPVLQVMKKFSSSYDGTKMVFESASLENAMQAFDHTLGEASKTINEIIHVALRKNGTFLAKFKGSGNYEGWTTTPDGFQRELPVVHKSAQFNKSILDEADQFVRHVVTPDNEPFGWAVKGGDVWRMYPGYDPISCVVARVFGKDSNIARAEMTTSPWTLHHLPFGLEYPGGRLWNQFAPQLAIQPSEEAGPHPTWDRIFDHLGQSLDVVVAQTDWCQQWGMHTGADYLRAWVAAMFRFPLKPLPYLFFYGPQNTGKSVFHESISTLLTCGVTSIKTALCSNAGYNQEISNVILGHVEEKDLSVVKDGAYDRIKEWCTAKTMLIHKKGHTPYNRPNTLHMVQMANRATSCQMEDGDTRITAILVFPINEIIPETPFFNQLAEEAQYFVRTLLTLSLPESHTRLRVPMIASEHKKDLEEMSQTPFESFAEETLRPCDGQSVKFTDFYERYLIFCTSKSIEPNKRNFIIQLLRNRADKYLLGIGRGKQMSIANVTMDSRIQPKKKLKLTDKGRLSSV